MCGLRRQCERQGGGKLTYAPAIKRHLVIGCERAHSHTFITCYMAFYSTQLALSHSSRIYCAHSFRRLLCHTHKHTQTSKNSGTYAGAENVGKRNHFFHSAQRHIMIFFCHLFLLHSLRMCLFREIKRGHAETHQREEAVGAILLATVSCRCANAKLRTKRQTCGAYEICVILRISKSTNDERNRTHSRTWRTTAKHSW